MLITSHVFLPFMYVPVNVDTVPEVETSVGYEGTSALDVCDLPRDISSNNRLCTQSRSGT